MKSTYESMMDVDVRAEGKSLVYDLTYKTELPEESLDTVKSGLESAFESLSSTYEGIANSIKESVGIDDPSVVVKSILKTVQTFYQRHTTQLNNLIICNLRAVI